MAFTVIQHSRFTLATASGLVAMGPLWAMAPAVLAAPVASAAPVVQGVLAGSDSGPGPGSDSGPGFSLSVTPARLVVPPGELGADQVFRVTNGGDAPIDVHVEKSDFTADRSGTVVLRERAPYSASTWVTAVPGEFRLAPGVTRQVRVRIAVPDAPEPGDHQVALVFTVDAGARGGNIRINRGVGVPLFIGVPGYTHDAAEVTALRAPGFAVGGPVPITAGIRSTGTAHRDFLGAGRLSVRVNGADVPFPGFTVMRGATREVTTRWDPPTMCVCRATVSVPLPGGLVRALTVTIVVFPAHLLAVLLIALALVLLLVRFLRRGHRARVVAVAGAMSAVHGGGDD